MTKTTKKKKKEGKQKWQQVCKEIPHLLHKRTLKSLHCATGNYK